MKIIFQKAVRKKIFLLLFLLAAIILLDSSGLIRRWLSVNNPVPSKVLVCDGWLSSYYYDSIAAVFENHHYDKLLLTGSKLPDGVLLSQNGSLILKNFNFSDTKEYTEKRFIRIFLKGSKSDGEYAKCILYKNDLKISDTIEVRNKIHLFYRIPLNNNDSLVIQFINDKFRKYSDRNIILKSCYIDNYTVQMHSRQVWLKYRNIYTNTDARSFSENTAKHLISKGIPKDKVFFLTSTSKGISKTYTTSSDAISWLIKENIPSANVITANYHSRRTYYSYIKANPDYKIGMLTLPDKSHQSWINSKLRTLKEISGCFFIKLTPRRILERQ